MCLALDRGAGLFGWRCILPGRCAGHRSVVIWDLEEAAFNKKKLNVLQ